MMKNWMKSGDGFLKRTKKAITKAMPGRSSVVDNKSNPASAHSMVMRATEAKKKANTKGLRATIDGK